jgi:hypothetical protein
LRSWSRATSAFLISTALFWSTRQASAPEKRLRSGFHYLVSIRRRPKGNWRLQAQRTAIVFAKLWQGLVQQRRAFAGPAVAGAQLGFVRRLANVRQARVRFDNWRLAPGPALTARAFDRRLGRRASPALGTP